MSNQFVLKPNTQSVSFGNISEHTSKGTTIPAGEIRLRNGKHFGVNRGFGVEHIWAEHQKEMLNSGFESKEDVPAYVASIVTEGASVYSDFSAMRGAQKLTVVRTKVGMAVLEYRTEGEDSFYSIVTAYSQKTAHGIQIGTVRK